MPLPLYFHKARTAENLSLTVACDPFMYCVKVDLGEN